MSDQSDQTPANQPDPEPVKINVSQPVDDKPAEPVIGNDSNSPTPVTPEPASVDIKPQPQAEPVKIGVEAKDAPTESDSPAITPPIPEPAKADPIQVNSTPEPSASVKAEVQKLAAELGDKPDATSPAEIAKPATSVVPETAKEEPVMVSSEVPTDQPSAVPSPTPSPVSHPGSGKLIVVVLILILAVSGIFLGWKTLSKTKKTPTPAAPVVEAPKFDDLKVQLPAITGGQKGELAITTPAEWKGGAEATCNVKYNDTQGISCAKITFGNALSGKPAQFYHQIYLYDATDWLKVDLKCASKVTECNPTGLGGATTKKNKQDKLNFLLSLNKDSKLSNADIAKGFGPSDGNSFLPAQKVAYFETTDGFKGLTFITTDIGQDTVYDPVSVFYAVKKSDVASLIAVGFVEIKDKEVPAAGEDSSSQVKTFQAGNLNQDTQDFYQKFLDALKTLKITVTK
ncbi:MAG TPA: hypothetical protein VLF41_00255 [Candidatus Nanoarchaeia archaeon]|nr:hypothetical protein [Candidatus Nanoarchaeia archaeon]